MENKNIQASENNNAAPAATGERTFTQEEVNRIISDRLARERAKDTQTDSRESDLAKRENALKCREFVITNSEEYPAGILEVLDTSDFEKFKAAADKLLSVFPELVHHKKAARFAFTSKMDKNNTSSDPFAEAFKPR